MKPLLNTVVALCLLLFVHALPENIEDVKELPQYKEPVVEAEESEPQARVERCTTCTTTLKLKTPKDILAAFQALPGSEVHSQQSFEECSSDKGCAGLKIKDGKVIERYGNVDEYKAAAAADVNNEFNFFAGFGNTEPFWWMGQNSPFKAGAGNSGSFQKFSKSSSYSSSGSTGAGTSGVGAFGGALDLAGNPFLNGNFGKLGTAQTVAAIKPTNFQSSSSYETSYSSSSNNGEVDISKNPFLNGGFKAGQVGAGFQSAFGANGGSSQGFGASGAGALGFGAGGASAQNFAANSASSQNFGGSYGAGFASGNKASTGYVGSSPTPFSATPISNVNLIQNGKASEFDFEQQQQTQQSIDKIFQGAATVGLDTSGGDLQQTCATEGYSCVIKSQCNNGVAYLRTNPRKQYCNVRTEVCCKIEYITTASQSTFGAGSTLNQGSAFGTSQSGVYGSTAGSAFGAQGSTQSAFGSNVGLGATGVTSAFGAKGTSSFGSVNRGVGSTGVFGSTIAPTTPRFGSTNGFKATGQSNFIETDSFSAGSENAGVYRPGAIGSNLKPGIPYLPPVDSTNSGTNIVSSTAFPTPTFVTTPRPIITAKPTYLPPPPVTSTSAPGYLPPVGEQTINRETIVPPNPVYEGSLILDENRQPLRPNPPPVANEIPAGCAAALKCTPIEFCTAEGVISNTTVILTRDQDAYRVPLTDCKDIETGRIGKCCRDPFYTDPWPTNQLGKWVPGVFGGNDGKYVPDSGVSSNNIRPTVTARPPVTGSVILNNFITPKPTLSPFGPNQVTPGYPSSTSSPLPQKGQFGRGGQGQFTQGGQGQFGIGSQGQYGQTGQGQLGIVGQGQIGSGSQVNTAFTQGQFGQKGQGQIATQGVGQVSKLGQGQYGQGQIITQGVGQVSKFGQGQVVTQGTGQISKVGQGQFGQGQIVSQGQGQIIKQGQGQYAQGGKGQFGVVGQGSQTQFGVGQKGVGVIGGQGVGIKRGQGQFVTQGQGKVVSQGQGFAVTQGQGSAVSQGIGSGIRQGQGQIVTQGGGATVSQGFGSGIRQGQGQIVTQGEGATVSQGFGTGIRQGQGQYTSQGQGQIVSQGQGQYESQGQGQLITQGQGQFGTQGQGQIVTQGLGQFGSQGQGQIATQGGGQTVTQGQGQFGTRGQGQLVTQGGGQIVTQGQGQFGTRGQGQFGTQGQGQILTQGQGQFGTQGQGLLVAQGQGQFGSQGQGQLVTQGQGQLVTQGEGQYVSQGVGELVSQGQGQYVSQGQGQLVNRGQGLLVSQGFGQSIRQGQGFQVSQGNGVGVENEYGESVRRVFLQQYNGGGQCGVLNGQRPNGNRKNLEVDFAEIPWQAMVLLQTNRSLLCGGVITRPDVVVTSAACVEGLEAKNVLIKGGEWKLGIDDEPLPFQIVQVKTIVRHPFYKPGSLLYDAAILVLNENLRFAKNIYPICLPGADETLDAYYSGAGQCIVTGWGKQVLQAHLSGSIMHSLNVSLIKPDDCQAKLTSDYPHLLDQYDEDSCVCGEPSNPLENICRVDIGSALACTSGDGHFVLRGVYSWDSGCQVGNQIAAFYRFDLEWYQWAIGLIESVRFAQFTTTTKITGQFSSGVKGFGGVKGSQYSGVKGSANSGVKGFGLTEKTQFGFGQGVVNQNQFTKQVNQFTNKVSSSGSSQSGFGSGFGFTGIKPISNGFSATYSEKKVFQTEPKIISYTTKPEIVTYTTKPEIVTYTTKPEIVTFTTKPEIVTFTTKPEYFTYTTKPKIVTYTTKPKIVTYTTKPQFITYETSGSGTNPQYVAPGVTFNPSFADLVGKHQHTAKCKCVENKK